MSYIDLDEEVVAADRREFDSDRRGGFYILVCIALVVVMGLVTAAIKFL